MRLLLVLTAVAAYGQTFPSDGQDPAKVNGAELLAAACTGKVQVAKAISCPACPEGALLQSEWVLTKVTFGHFATPTGDDAVLAMSGCEPHVENFGGSVLLTRQGGKWKKLSYRPGVITQNCHKVTGPAKRDLLVCLGGYMQMGEGSTYLVLEDPAAGPDTQDTPFFLALDDTATCGIEFTTPKTAHPVTRSGIEKVQFTPANGGALPHISVTAFRGTRNVTLAQGETCAAGHPLAPPPTKTYQLEFHYDGHDYQPTPASEPAAKLFAGR